MIVRLAIDADSTLFYLPRLFAFVAAFAMIRYSTLSSFSAYLHHAVIGGAFLVGIYGRVASPYHFFFLLEELSTPSLNLKQMYKHQPKRYSRVNTFTNITFPLFFFLSRIVYGMYIFAFALKNMPEFARGVEYGAGSSANATAFALMVAQCTLCCLSRALNLYWMWLIIGKVRKALRGDQSTKPRSGKVAPTSIASSDKTLAAFEETEAHHDKLRDGDAAAVQSTPDSDWQTVSHKKKRNSRRAD